jgi:hypothetical protein
MMAAPLPNPLMNPAAYTVDQLWAELELNLGRNDATVRAVLMAAERNKQNREHTGLALSIILAQQLAETRARLVRATEQRKPF